MKTAFPVKFKFQISNKYFNINMSYAMIVFYIASGSAVPGHVLELTPTLDGGWYY